MNKLLKIVLILASTSAFAEKKENETQGAKKPNDSWLQISGVIGAKFLNRDILPKDVLGQSRVFGGACLSLEFGIYFGAIGRFCNFSLNEQRQDLETKVTHRAFDGLVFIRFFERQVANLPFFWATGNNRIRLIGFGGGGSQQLRFEFNDRYSSLRGKSSTPYWTGGLKIDYFIRESLGVAVTYSKSLGRYNFEQTSLNKVYTSEEIMGGLSYAF